MELTKKYRIVWSDDKVFVQDHTQNYEGSTTFVGSGLNYFESNSLTEIENKIESEILIYQQSE